MPLPLKGKVPNATSVRDLVGFPIGAAVADGTLFAPNDNGYLYALNPLTGKPIWRFNARNQIMTTPLVVAAGGKQLVVVGGGNSVFSYSHAVKFGVPGAQVVRGTDFSGIYALDAATGKTVWSFPTRGEDMPTPVFYDGKIIFGNGDGHVYALDAATGKLLWKTFIRSFVSMSSADVGHGVVVLGGTHPSYLYGLDAATGKLRWKVRPQGVFSSSMGDGTPAVAGKLAVIQIEITSGKAGTAASEEVAVDLATGKVQWETVLGRGKVPPRNKDANPIIVGGVVYTGSPVTATEYALNLATGAVLWSTPLQAKVKAAPTLVGRDLVVPAATGAIFTLDAKTGRILNTYRSPDGGYGPQNAVVVGKTLFIGSNFGWFDALPLPKILGKAGS